MKYYIHKDIILTKGVVRSVLQDFTRADYQLIPNEIYDILVENEGKCSVTELKDKIIEVSEDEKYFNLVVNNEYVYESIPEFHERIKAVSTTFELPFRLQSVRIDVPDSIKKMKRLLDFITKDLALQMQTKVIEYSNVSNENISDLLDCVKNINEDRIVEHIFITNEEIEIDEEFLISLNSKMRKVKENKLEFPKFFSNRTFYNESISYNTFTNGRITINSDSTVNTYSGNFSIFNYSNSIELIEFVKSKNFWETPKSTLEKCRLCEFRNMCLTNNKLKANGKSIQYQKECIYNPKTGEWS